MRRKKKKTFKGEDEDGVRANCWDVLRPNDPRSYQVDARFQPRQDVRTHPPMVLLVMA